MGNQNKFSALNSTSKSGMKSGGKTVIANAKKTVPAKVGKDLVVDTARSAPAAASAAVTQLPGHDGEVDANTVKRIIAAHVEYYGNDLIDEIVDVLKELVHENGMWVALHSTMKSVMGLSAPTRDKYSILIPKLYKRKVLNREQAVKGISHFLDEFDEFVMDVPLLAGYFSTILAHMFIHNVFEGDVRFISTLPDENDFSISMRMMSVIVQTSVTIKTLSSEEKAIEFFKSSLDLAGIDAMQQEQLTEAIEKYDAQFLQQQQQQQQV